MDSARLSSGVDPGIFQRSDQIAASWRSRYDGLRLDTLGWMSTQPGCHVGRRLRHFPSREEWIGYLERYARHHTPRIQLQTEVERIDLADGHWRVGNLHR
ncbi:MAG: hypothetical protein ACRDNE_00920 [Gaiellaceae bacterium]